MFEKTPDDVAEQDLRNFMKDVLYALYGEPDTSDLNPTKEWDSSTLDSIANALADYLDPNVTAQARQLTELAEGIYRVV